MGSAWRSRQKIGRSADTAKFRPDTRTLTAMRVTRALDTSLAASAFTVKWTSADLLDDLHRLRQNTVRKFGEWTRVTEKLRRKNWLKPLNILLLQS